MLFQRWFGLNAVRERQCKKAPEGPLKSFLSVPFPEPQTPIKEVELLALDFETTGLNSKKDHILSVGCTPIHHGIICLADSLHTVVNHNIELERENVQIHQITDNEQAQGQSLERVIEQLLAQLAGKVMLVHFAHIERSFLQQACLQLYGVAPVFPIIDTLQIAKRRFDLSDTPYDPSRLRLANLRQEYGLPPHYEHNALNDAVASGELLLAQLSQLTQGRDTPLKKLLV
ncbi:DNA polymerase III subunit epsilon [Parashewanella curva]|uniref:DNA polymerase III subunit epsilon n=1 Tax=Parashewanella curva TaxID=2338552 RepID=A0A3L8PV43_9GAMM|nr:exonuclease domain-containing protein [Parashewanella curva]RLV59297.1 DNA polymerase III subunit epsilon [Parashewanella curva]